MKKIFILLSFAALLAGAAPPEVVARRTSPEPTMDGRLDGSAWKKAVWVTLDRSRPAQPKTEAEWGEIERAAGTTGYAREQFAQKVRAAALWSERGLFFAFEVEDVDVTGRMKDGDALWLEDAVEVFLAPQRKAGAPVLELQLNPANAVYLNPPFPRPETGTAVEGTLNRSLERDRKWTAVLFLPWEELERTGFARRPDATNGGVVAAIRFAAWDLSIYSQIRLNRFTGPGEANPHHPEFYRVLRCE